jgi:hypothetical protein
MDLPESATGLAAACSWKTYSVSRAAKAPLMRFIADALRMRGCEVIFASDPARAPFYIVFDTPTGERHGLLAYAFLANTKLTLNRPSDEHRFQIKYGGELKGVLEVGVDPNRLITTIFLGIDLERGLFVAADPVMNNPSPMSRSVEFKARHVDEILAHGWSAWERDRIEPRAKTRPTATLDEDTRVQVLIGGVQERLFDLIQLERLSRGLDTGERHLIADKLAERAKDTGAAASSHKLLGELGLAPEALFDLIDGANRLKMAVRGWVAEVKLVDSLRRVPGVTDCHRIEGEGQPDVMLRWKGGMPLFIECKNVLRKTDQRGRPRVDFQRTRASKGDPCSRYYRPADFSILAACLHAVTEDWRFSFAATADMPRHKTCSGHLSNNVLVDAPLFTSDPELVFYKCSVEP